MMASTPKKFYIKERFNPQLGIYYVACGQMSKTAARRAERSAYGANIMQGYNDETSYNAKLDELRREGKSVQAN